MAEIATSVMIVGGGPAGLAASICLSQFGVDSLLVEQHATTTAHPKATVVNARTFELFRQWGIDDAVRAGGLPPERARFIVWATSLTGYELGRLDLEACGDASLDPADAVRQAGRLSPAMTGICPQDVYEPILRARAAAAPGAALRFHTRLESFRQADEGVSAVVRDLDSGRAQRVAARYLLACDGAASGVREQLGIAMRGPDDIGSILNIYCHADLQRFIAGREGPLYWILNADLAGVFIALDGRHRWLFNTPIRGAGGQRFSDDWCAAQVRRAAGDAALAVDVRSVDPWVMRSQVAERYRAGRAFLVGDAAHRFPPTGGFGMNTGVQDAHNLAWKLAAVLQGWAPPALLDTYDTERRPVGQSNADQSLKNNREMPVLSGETGAASPLARIEEDSLAGEQLRGMVAAGIAQTREHFSFMGQAKGFAYDSPVIVADGTAPAADARSSVERYVPAARPGNLAPHAWIERDGRVGSLLDLFGTRFVLLAGPRGAAWRAAAAALTDGPPLTAYVVGEDVTLADSTPADWCDLYGLAPDGAVLVRPDGHVAWRAARAASDCPAALRRAANQATGG